MCAQGVGVGRWRGGKTLTNNLVTFNNGSGKVIINPMIDTWARALCFMQKET